MQSTRKEGRSSWRYVKARIMRALASCAMVLVLCQPQASAASQAVRVFKRADNIATTTTSLDRVYTFSPSYARPPLSLSWASRGSVERSARLFDGNAGVKEQETDDKQDKDPCEKESSGNPVVLSTGNKVEPELDFASGGEMGLYLRRTYNHHWSSTGLFGKHWLSNFDYTLTPSEDAVFFWAQRPNGRRIKFVHNATSGRWEESKTQPVAWIVANGDGTFTLRNEDNGTERYNSDGYLIELKSEQGIAWYFAYTGKYLQQVTHSSGRSIRFIWNGSQLSQVIDPGGSVYRYRYDVDVFAPNRHRLAGVTLPGAPATVVDYHYEDPRWRGGLTGKSFNGVRYSTFEYNSDGRAIRTEHAGGVERFTFAYGVDSSESVTPPPAPPPPGGYQDDEERKSCTLTTCYLPRSGGMMLVQAATTSTSRPTRLRVTETSPLGRQTVHVYENGRKVAVEGSASPSCPASYKELHYDVNGYEDIVSDFNGSLTNFDYDAHGHLLQKVEAAGTAQARTTSYAWDEPGNRLVRETITGDTETALAYTGNGRLASVAVKNLTGRGVAGQSLTTAYRYTYHANGLLASMTVDGPLPGDGDAVTSTYSPKGDLLTVRNGLGHTTSYSGYDAMGRPGSITDPTARRRSTSTTRGDASCRSSLSSMV